MKDSLKKQNCTIEQVEEQVNDSQDKPIEFNVRKKTKTCRKINKASETVEIIHALTYTQWDS